MIDSKKLVFECYRQAFEESGTELTEATFKTRIWNQSSDKFPSGFLQSEEEIRARKNELFLEQVHTLKVNERAFDVLRGLYFSCGIILYLVTGGSYEATNAKINLLPQPFRSIEVFAEVNKQNRWAWNKLAEQVDPRETLVIDDCIEVLKAAELEMFHCLYWKEFLS